MKNCIKNLLCVMLSFTLVGQCVFNIRAEEIEEEVLEEQTEEIKSNSFGYVNPIYADVLGDESLSGETNIFDEEIFSENENSSTVFSTIEEASRYVRSNMKNRNREVYFGFKSSQELSESDVKKIVDLALEHTKVPNEGDYLSYQYARWNVSYSWSYQRQVYSYSFQFQLDYYSDINQEAVVSKKVQEVLSSLNLNEKTTYQKIKAIYDYICSNVSYDNEHLNDNSYKLQYTAYGALINKTSVCQGYAVLLYRMLLEENIDCRIISGIGNGGRHGWNIVQLGPYYYNLDATWDTSYKEIDMDYQYFLRNDANFEDHYRDEEYSTTSFYNNYPMSYRDYPIDCKHVWNNGVVQKNASCTEKGSIQYTFTYCLETKNEAIPALGHNVVKDSAKEATCTESGITEGEHCSLCHEILVSQKTTNPLGHRWNDGEVILTPSLETNGKRKYTCLNDSSHTKEEDIPKLVEDCLEGYKLSLSGNIGVHFYMSLPLDAEYMEFTLPNGKIEKMDISQSSEESINGNEYTVFSCFVSAKEMTGTIRAQMHYKGNVLGKEYSYSVEDYANYLINHASQFDSKSVSLAKSMLTYGKYAQEYFAYNTTHVPSQVNTIKEVDLKSYAYRLTDNNDSIDFLGARLVLTSKPGLKLYFIGDGTFSVEGKIVDSSKEGKYTVVTISDIDSMEKMYTISTDNFKLEYSIISYGNQAIATSNSKLKKLIYAMYEYNQALFIE